ncbi:hypothetical protein FQA39_LY07484 [Lamprigera yunnana]|nr:hypothetical protein FQA39_LY07484 [Lamprigera yunnana]
MQEDNEKQETYVLLNFQGKDMTKLLKQTSIYFRMLNLNEPKPIIEVGDDIFEGVYEDAVGTNIFFEEVEIPRPRTNLFEGDETPITLEYFLKQSKILRLTQIGTKPKVVINQSPINTVHVDITDDYRILLEKYVNDTLNIENYVVNKACLNDDSVDDTLSPHSDEEEVEEKAILQPELSKVDTLTKQQTQIPKWYSSAVDCDMPRENSIYLKYLKLQEIAKQPVKHVTEQEINQDDQFEQPLHSVPNNNFIIWKNMMMRVVEQQTINLDVNKYKIEDFVDIENSVKLGIIESSDVLSRTYTKYEKQKLFSFKNFINLSPLMKLVVLQDCLQFEKAEIENMNDEQANIKCEDGCTPKERVILLNDFKEELKSYILNRIKDIKNFDSTLAKIDLNINLSDDEEESLDELSSDDYDQLENESKSEGMCVNQENENSSDHIENISQQLP